MLLVTAITVKNTLFLKLSTKLGAPLVNVCVLFSHVGVVATPATTLEASFTHSVNYAISKNLLEKPYTAHCKLCLVCRIRPRNGQFDLCQECHAVLIVVRQFLHRSDNQNQYVETKQDLQWLQINPSSTFIWKVCNSVRLVNIVCGVSLLESHKQYVRPRKRS